MKTSEQERQNRREYYHAHKREILQRNKERLANNPDLQQRRTDTRKRHYLNHKETWKHYSEIHKSKMISDPEYRQRHLERQRALRKVRYERNIDASRTEARKQYFRKKYGITLEQRRAMLEVQNGRCAICACELKLLEGDVSPGRGKSKVHVDHDHESGEIRGILCWNCNKALGLMLDDPRRLYEAASYLIKHHGQYDEREYENY
jgi:hypothetical protein